jgi:cobalt-precorrin 5A hydrolase
MMPTFDSVYVFSCSPFGRDVARRVAVSFPGVSVVHLGKDSSVSVDGVFREAHGGKRVLLVFVCALGICVRKIAPFVCSKFSDPAVVCLDDGGSFVIPVLSGHLGGANEAARALASSLGAVPVVTTSTDVHGKWALDTWAESSGFLLGALSSSLSPLCADGRLSDIVRFANSASISSRRIFSVGIGCKRGCGSEKLFSFVESVFSSMSLPFSIIGRVSSIDLKIGEKAIVDFAASVSAELSFFSSGELLSLDGMDWISIDGKRAFSSSPFVLEKTGVDCVCERCSVLASEKRFLVARKTAADGMTVAVSI